MSEYLIRLIVDDRDCDYASAVLFLEEEIRSEGIIPFRDQVASQIWVAMITSGRIANETTMVDAILKADLLITKLRDKTSDGH